MSHFTPQLPPGTGGFQHQSPYPQARLQPLRSRAGFARTGAWLMMSGNIVGTAWMISLYRAVQSTDPAAVERSELWAIPVLLVMVCTGVIAWIATARWLAVARRNAELLMPAAKQALGPAWVWWSWVVPIVSWWFPRRIVLDICPDVTPGSSTRALVNRWWCWWMLVIAVGVISARLDDADPGQAGAAAVLALTSTIFLGLALRAWLQLVGWITEAQDHAIAAVPPARPLPWSG